MHKNTRKISTKSPLTLKQMKFKKNYLENGGNASQACKDAGYNVTSNESQRVLGHLLRHNPKIVKEISQALEENGLIGDRMFSVLSDIIYGDDIAPRDKLASIRTVLELDGSLKNTTGSTNIVVAIGDNKKVLSEVCAKDLYSARNSLEKQLSAVNERIAEVEALPCIQETPKE